MNSIAYQITAEAGTKKSAYICVYLCVRVCIYLLPEDRPPIFNAHDLSIGTIIPNEAEYAHTPSPPSGSTQ